MNKLDLIIDRLELVEKFDWNTLVVKGSVHEALAAARELQQELAKPEQEPEIVRRVRRYTGKRRESVGSPHINAKECIALANWIDSILAAPPRKPWVGLTDEEINLIYADPQTHVGQYARAIEAKLKEKNSKNTTVALATR